MLDAQTIPRCRRAQASISEVMHRPISASIGVDLFGRLALCGRDGDKADDRRLERDLDTCARRRCRSRRSRSAADLLADMLVGEADVGFLPIYSSSPSMARSRMIFAAFTCAIADALLDPIICTSRPSASSPLTLLRLPGGRPLGLPLCPFFHGLSPRYRGLRFQALLAMSTAAIAMVLGPTALPSAL